MVEGIPIAEDLAGAAKDAVKDVPIVNEVSESVPGVGGEEKGAEIPGGDLLESAKDAVEGLAKTGVSAADEAVDGVGQAATTPAQEAGEKGMGIG